MDRQHIRHRPRHIDFVVSRRLEIEPEIMHAPVGLDHINASCPECGYTMMYRGKARLRNGSVVHHFECIHSYREVYSLSVIAGE